jgi:hypothetical protein
VKKGKRKRQARSQAQEAFVRGFVATALLASLDRSVHASGGLARTSMWRALKGGIAIASGTLVAEALQERKYSKSLIALAAGAAGMAIVGRYPTPDETAQADESSGQEKEIEQVQG